MTEQLAQLAKILGPAAPFPEAALAGAGTGTGADLRKKNPLAPAKKVDSKTPGGARQPASTAADAQKTATPTTPTETPTPPTPAPTSTIIRSDKDSSNATQQCPPGRIDPSSEATSAASENAADAGVAAGAAAGAPKESEPVYRVEEVFISPSANGGGAGRKGKRAFVVTVELPDLIEGDAEGSNEGAESADSSISGGWRRKGKGPSLSDFELDVLPTVLQLKIPGKYQLRLEMPCTVDDENVTAKFNKSRAVLKVSMQEK